MKLKRACAVFICVLLIFASGCSGSLSTDAREIEELLVIQTMGFDSDGESVTVSASAGNSGESGGSNEGGKSTAMRAEADSISRAEEILQDYSAKEELFFSHISYVAVGKASAEKDLSFCFDYIRQGLQIRLRTPIFIITNTDAADFIVGAQSAAYDATDVLRSIERDADESGVPEVFSAASIFSSLDENGSALICALRAADAGKLISSGDAAFTAVPDGYAIVKGSRVIGSIDADCARAVSLLKGKVGTDTIQLELDNAIISVQPDKCSCEISPIYNNVGTLCGWQADVKLNAALVNENGDISFDRANKALEDKVQSWFEEIFAESIALESDFLHLGAMLERKYPQRLEGMSRQFQTLLPGLDCKVIVSAEIDRSFNLDFVGGQS